MNHNTRFHITPYLRRQLDAHHPPRLAFSAASREAWRAWRRDLRAKLRELLGPWPEPVDLATADVSFISLELILPALVRWLLPDGQTVALIKPQFEAGRRQVEKGGVVRDPEIHRRVLGRVLGIAAELGLGLRGLMPSPRAGN